MKTVAAKAMVVAERIKCHFLINRAALPTSRSGGSYIDAARSLSFGLLYLIHDKSPRHLYLDLAEPIGENTHMQLWHSLKKPPSSMFVWRFSIYHDSRRCHRIRSLKPLVKMVSTPHAYWKGVVVVECGLWSAARLGQNERRNTRRQRVENPRGEDVM